MTQNDESVSEGRSRKEVQVERETYLELVDKAQRVETAVAVLSQPYPLEEDRPTGHGHHERPSSESRWRRTTSSQEVREEGHIDERPIGDDVDSRYGGKRRVANQYTSQISVFRRVTLWSGLASLLLLISLVLLAGAGALPPVAVTIVGALLLASTTIFLKIWHDLGGLNHDT